MAKNSNCDLRIGTITIKLEDQELPDANTMNSNGDLTKSAPALLKSVSELNNLSNVLHVFKCKWDELQKHLDFIETAIKDLEPPLSDEASRNVTVVAGTNTEQLVLLPDVVIPQYVQNLVPASVKDIASSSKSDVTTVTEQPLKSVEGVADSSIIGETTNIDDQKKPPLSEYELTCSRMGGRELKRLITSHLASPLVDVAKLRADVIAAIKVAPNPDRLVLQAVGGFYLQGSKAYSKASPLSAVRKTSILILELFLLTGLCSTGKIDPEVKKESAAAAIAWMKRLVSEGGVSQASLYDARGLLLFIGCFGIPREFRSYVIKDLICLSKPKEISEALRQSHALLTKIQGTIEATLKNGPIDEAVDIAITFGVEDKFQPEQVLLKFLRSSEDDWKKGMKEALVLTRHEANKKYYAALKSVQKCLEKHKIDPSLFQTELQMKEKITILENQIAEFEKKRQEENRHKRKANEAELSRVEAERRSRYTTSSKPTLRSLEHMIDSKMSYDDGLTQRYLMAGGRSGHINSFHNPSSSDALSLRANHLDALAAKYGSGLSTGSIANSFPGILSSNSQPGIQSANLFNGVIGDSRGENSRAASGASNPSYGWPVDQSLDRQSAAMGISSIYQQPASTSAANRSAAPDLYQFADAVVDRGSNYTLHPNLNNVVNRTTSAYHPSYRF